MKALTYKQLINKISEIKNEKDFNETCGAIDRSFQAEKITANDNETLYRIMRIISEAIRN